MSLRVAVSSGVKAFSAAAAAKASLNRAQQLGAADAKPSDLPMGRVKLW